MTNLQAKMIREIALSDFSRANGQESDTLDDVGEVWMDCNAQDKGTLTSLVMATFNAVDHAARERAVRSSGMMGGVHFPHLRAKLERGER